MSSTPTAVPSLTPAELNEALSKLQPGDWRKLNGVARSHLASLKSSSKTFDDLRQEVICRALSGERHCPANIPVLLFLMGVMRSLVSADRAIEQRRSEPLLMGGEGGNDIACDALSPERLVLSSRDDRYTLSQIAAVLADDPKLTELLEAMLDGIKGTSLQQALRISAGELETLRRKFRRRINVVAVARLEREA